MTLKECPYEQVKKVYDKFFSLGFLNKDVQSKLALISLICRITYEVNKKKNFTQNISCYQIICKIGGDMGDDMKNTVFKSLGAICDDLSYGCDSFPDFGLKLAEMPQMVRKLLGDYSPF